MRCVASCGLLALGLLGGCNQVFGISNTVAFDAPIDAVVNRSFVTLEWQVSTSTDAPMLVPIAPMPKVRMAKLGEPLADLPMESAATYADDGRIDIPTDYVTTPWRMEYTLADGVPHEVQWQPDDKTGRIVVPLFGPIQRDPVPSGSGYNITTSGAPGGTFSSGRLFTTGLWTEAMSTTESAMFNAATLTSMSGPLGRVDAPGDRATYVAYATNSDTCEYSTASAELMNRGLMPNAQTVNALTWVQAAQNPNTPVVDLGSLGRLDAIGDLAITRSTSATKITYGVAPSVRMPGFAATQATSTLESLPFPMPVMVSLGRCPIGKPMPNVDLAASFSSFPKILHVQAVGSRKVLGNVTLSSGMENVLAASAAGDFNMVFPAPFPTEITFTSPASPGGQPTSLGADAQDPMMISRSNTTYLLSFTPETGTNYRVDAYDVLLHAIQGTTLTTERVYTVPAVSSTAAATVQIDSALLSPGNTYVFEIRAVKGPIRAPHGDFSVVDYPYGQTITFARTFTVQ